MSDPVATAVITAVFTIAGLILSPFMKNWLAEQAQKRRAEVEVGTLRRERAERVAELLASATWTTSTGEKAFRELPIAARATGDADVVAAVDAYVRFQPDGAWNPALAAAQRAIGSLLARL